jgi:hypothetical protein
LVIFLLPIAINSLHDFMNHEHTVCVSKIENHLHEKELDCDLHLIKQNDFSLLINNLQLFKNTDLYLPNKSHYYFLKNHYKLSFSLRGPPLVL